MGDPIIIYGRLLHYGVYGVFGVREGLTGL